jgi:hypothetical protein
VWIASRSARSRRIAAQLLFMNPPSASSSDMATMRVLMRLWNGLRRPETCWLRHCWSKSSGLRPTGHPQADVSLGLPADGTLLR